MIGIERRGDVESGLSGVAAHPISHERDWNLHLAERCTRTVLETGVIRAAQGVIHVQEGSLLVKEHQHYHDLATIA